MEPAVLLYDGACNSCSTFARLVERADLRGRIRTRPLEDPEMRKRYAGPLGPRYFDSFHLDTGHRIASGAEALPDLLGLLPGGRLWAPLARLPVCREVLARGYREMARLRDRTPCARDA